jgi:hypothetical protein
MTGPDQDVLDDVADTSDNIDAVVCEISLERMPPGELVDALVNRLECGYEEVASAQSKQLEGTGRLAPGFVFGQLNKEAPR